MFACSHIYFTLARDSDASDERLLGCVYADAAATGAFSWEEFHTWANLDALDDSDFSQGLRDHLELDDRSHHSWNGGGGYAYDRQTPELIEAVSAFELDDARTRTLAHNFIEYGVDVRLRRTNADIFQQLQRVSAIDRAAEYIQLITKPLSDEEFWVELLKALNKSTFDSAVRNIEAKPIRKAIDVAVDLVEHDYMYVISPGRA